MSAFLHVHASLYWVEAILEDSCRLRRHLFSAAVDGLKYADSHEWAKIDGETATIGISDFAQVFSRPCSHRNNCSHLTSSPIVMSSFTSHFVGFAASDPMLTNQVPSNRSLAWAERIGYLLGFKVNIFNLGSTPIRKLKAVCCNSLQAELGDIVFVELPEVGDEVTQGQSFGVVESVKVNHYLLHDVCPAKPCSLAVQAFGCPQDHVLSSHWLYAPFKCTTHGRPKNTSLRLQGTWGTICQDKDLFAGGQWCEFTVVWGGHRSQR